MRCLVSPGYRTTMNERTVNNDHTPSESIVLILDRRSEFLQDQKRWNDLKEQLKDFITMKQEFNSKNKFYLCDIGTEVGYHPREGDNWLPLNDRSLDEFFTNRNAIAIAPEATDLSEIFTTIEHKLNSGNNILRLIVIYASHSSVPIVNTCLSGSFVENRKPFVDVVYYVDNALAEKVRYTAWMWNALLVELNGDHCPNKRFFSVADGPAKLSRALAELLVHPDFRNLPKEFQVNPPRIPETSRL